jgi:hypothetical protein
MKYLTSVLDVFSHNYPMEYKKFKEKLVIAKLSVKEFCQKAKISYSTCNNWTTTSTPTWVDSWLDLYIENQKLNDIKKIALDIAKSEGLGS